MQLTLNVKLHLLSSEQTSLLEYIKPQLLYNKNISAGGGKKEKMSRSDMLIGNERPFSWDGWQHGCMMGN